MEDDVLNKLEPEKLQYSFLRFTGNHMYHDS